MYKFNIRDLRDYVKGSRVIAIATYQFIFKKLDNGVYSVILTDGTQAIGLNSKNTDDIKDFYLSNKEKILKKCNQI